jgi:hypothetical protein
MGLTHHWRRPTELPVEHFARAVNDFRKIVVTSRVALAGFDGTGSPILDDDHVVFNGVRGAHHEPFEIRRLEFDRHGRTEVFSFCKTQSLPYDGAVKAALIIFHHHLGQDFRVGSDEHEPSWNEARRWVVAALGYGSQFVLREE